MKTIHLTDNQFETALLMATAAWEELRRASSGQLASDPDLAAGLLRVLDLRNALDSQKNGSLHQ
jgi:hypothetical protein